MQDLTNVIKIAKATEPTIYTDEQLEVINNLIKYQKYYDNKSFDYIKLIYPEYGQRITDGKNYTPAQIPLNYGKYIVNKLAAWQFEDAIDFNCTSVKAQNRADEIESDLYDIHNQNLMDIKLLQSAQECNISGGVVFKLKYEDKVKKPYSRILPRNRIECFPVYEFDDYENIYRVHFIAFQDEKTIWKQTYDLVNGVCYIYEAIYDTKDIVNPAKVIIEYQPLGKNNKWLDFLPVYIIPNTPQLGEVWGMSEMEDLIPIIDEINKKYSDLSDSLRFDMFAITIMMNISPVNKNTSLKTKPGACWELAGGNPIDGIKPDVFKLAAEFPYIDTLKYHIDSLISIMFELSECVQLAADKVTGMAALSGVALKLLFAAIISKTTKKNTIWKAKLKEIYMGTLKLKAIYENYDIPDDLDIEIITHLPMPQNELEEIQVISAKLADSLISVTTAMNEIGIENPEAEIAKILEEKAKYDKALNIDQINNPTVNDKGNVNNSQIDNQNT